MIIETENIPELNYTNKCTNNSQNNQKILDKKQISTFENLMTYLTSKNNILLKDFEINEFLEYGGESVVYKVLHRKTKKPFVCKFIYTKDNEKRNINELNILNKLKNKNIMNFYGLIEIEKNKLDCVIMEYGTLGNIKTFMEKTLKKSYLSESLLCYFTFQILQALKYCHLCKICHFDIKPYNIIIDEFLNAKIIDFSISLDYNKIISKKIKTLFRGTNFYMSPEVLKTKTINIEDLNKVDIYSLGVTLYVLAFGCFPYFLKVEDNKDYEKIYNKIQNNNLEFDNKNNVFSSVFIDFLKKILEKDIDKRINIKQALNHEWMKAGNILFEEKEKMYNGSNFLIYLMTDNIFNFNKYLQEIEKSMKNK